MADFTWTKPSVRAGRFVIGDLAEMLVDGVDNIYSAWPSSWTPTLTNMTQGNGTVTARYKLVGKTVDYLFLFVTGSTSTVSSGAQFTLPFAPASHYSFAVEVGQLMLLDAGTNRYRGNVTRNGTGNVADLLWYSLASGAAGTVGGTSPFNWSTHMATGNAIGATGRYEIS